MSISINLGASGALAGYNDLLGEIRDQMDEDDLAQTWIDRALRKAEAHFNRELRTPDMEVSTQLVATTETLSLPTDFLQLRTIYLEGNPDFTLRSMSPASLTGTYNGWNGTPQAYAIVGRSLRFAPVGNGTVVVEYYQRIPALGPDTVSNWLLERHPDLYVAATLHHLFKRNGDAQAAADNLQITLGLIDSINRAGQSARWGAGPLVPMGMMQVRGVRA